MPQVTSLVVVPYQPSQSKHIPARATMPEHLPAVEQRCSSVLLLVIFHPATQQAFSPCAICSLVAARTLHFTYTAKNANACGSILCTPKVRIILLLLCFVLVVSARRFLCCRLCIPWTLQCLKSNKQASTHGGWSMAAPMVAHPWQKVLSRRSKASILWGWVGIHALEDLCTFERG